MKVTVAICTYNRAKDITEAIQSSLNQNFNPEELEVILVDNCSTDATADIVKKMQQHDHRLRYIFESKMGLSVARNRAIKEAKGEYIFFLDDDAIASKDWMKGIVDVFESDPKIGCVGGRIDPLWEEEEPKWVPKEYQSVFTILDFADRVTEMTGQSIPYGANVAFRTRVFKEIGLFREDLGRVGTNLLSSEESELIARLRSKYKVYYTPHAWVKHKISKERATKKWLLRRMYWQGVSDAVKRKDKSMIVIIKQAVRMLQASVLSVFSIFNLQRFIRQLVKISYRNGVIAGIIRYNGKG